MSIDGPDALLARAHWHAMQAKQNHDRAEKYQQRRKRWMHVFHTRNAEAHQRAAQILIRRANAMGARDE